MFENKGSYQDIDLRLHSLKENLDVYPLQFTYSKDEWEEIFDEIKSLNEDFKAVRYPSRSDRDNAWDTFCKLRNKAYESRNKQFSRMSEEHLDELKDMAKGLMVPIFATTIADLFPDKLRELKEDMVENGKQLGRTIRCFNELRAEMTREDKQTMQELIDEIKADHEEFWNEYSTVKEERHQSYIDKKQELKQRLEGNISKNEEKLEKAKEALERFEKQKEDLEEKIDDARPGNYLDRLEGWLDELNGRIESVEAQIERLEQWIKEDEDKLANL